MKLHYWAVAAAALAIVGSIGPRIVERARAHTVVVTDGELDETIIATALVQAADGVADVRSRIDGRIAKVLVREGDRVEPGQTLAEIEADEYATTLTRLEAERRSRIASANADVAAARQAYALAADRSRRARHLVASGAESAESSRDAASALTIARAELARAEANREMALGGKGAGNKLKTGDIAMDNARRALDWTRVVAPTRGVILARRVDPGDSVHPMSVPGLPALFEIADLEKTEVTAEVDEVDATRVQPGLGVDFVFSGSKKVFAHGQVTRIGAGLHRRTIGADDGRLRADTSVRSIWIDWAKRPDDEKNIPFGTRLEAIIHLPRRAVKARLPRTAIAVRDGHATIKVAKGLFVTERPVLLGAVDEQFVEVRDLAPGTKVLAISD